jgi:hypothetical protein
MPNRISLLSIAPAIDTDETAEPARFNQQNDDGWSDRCRCAVYR